MKRCLALSLIILIITGCFYKQGGYQYLLTKLDNQIIHLLTIDLKEYTVKLVKAHGLGMGRETVSSMAQRSGGDIAINGGYFKIGHGVDGMPSGTLVINGKIYGIKDKLQPHLIINAQKLTIEVINPQEQPALTGNPDISLLSAWPLLVNNGEIVVELLTKKDDSYRNLRARTALGIKPDGKIIIVVVERHEKAKGLSILSLAQLMKKSGCRIAVNLDGGGSSALWMHGKLMNQVIGDEDEGQGLAQERPVSDAVVFIKKDSSGTSL